MNNELDLYDAEMIDVMQQTYADDFETFGYDPVPK